jgi:hypothetical protein
MLRRRVVAALVVAIAAAGCSGSDDDTPERAARTHELATFNPAYLSPMSAKGTSM